MKNDKLNWYLEWIATAILIVGTAVNSLGYYPQGPLLLCLGGLIWFVVAVRWGKLSLMVVNGVMLLTGLSGLLWKYFV
jgi:hypothetical protein